MMKDISRNTKIALLVGCFVMFFISFIVLSQGCADKSINAPSSSSVSKSSSKNSDVIDVDDVTLITYAEFAVEDKLKSPSSAKFCAIDKFVVQRIGSSDDHTGYTTYGIKGYVDADNSYGSSLRSEFMVRIDAKPGEEKHYVLSCTIE